MRKCISFSGLKDFFSSEGILTCLNKLLKRSRIAIIRVKGLALNE